MLNASLQSQVMHTAPVALQDRDERAHATAVAGCCMHLCLTAELQRTNWPGHGPGYGRKVTLMEHKDRHVHRLGYF